MMDFIMVPAIMAIITVGIYKLFELFVCKKERLMLIEKMGDKYEPDVASIPRFHSNYSFSALKIGCLLLGMGLGLLIGFIICTSSVPGYLDKNMDDWRVYRETVSLVYGACVLVFGGIGLVAAFITELKLSKKKDEKALEEKSKIQKDAEGTLPGRQLGLYSKVDKKEVRNMVSEINPDKNSLGSRG